MTEPRRWKLAVCRECDAQLRWFNFEHADSCTNNGSLVKVGGIIEVTAPVKADLVEVIEAAPVEAELERLRMMLAAALVQLNFRLSGE